MLYFDGGCEVDALFDILNVGFFIFQTWDDRRWSVDVIFWVCLGPMVLYCLCVGIEDHFEGGGHLW